MTTATKRGPKPGNSARTKLGGLILADLRAGHKVRDIAIKRRVTQSAVRYYRRYLRRGK
jgi:hypothetical protein